MKMKKSAIKWIVIGVAIFAVIGAISSPSSEEPSSDTDIGTTETVSNNSSINEDSETTSKNENSKPESTISKEETSSTTISSKPTVSSTPAPQEESATSSISPQPEPPAENIPQDNSSKIVYITETGKKYHSTGTCRYLKNSNGVFESTISNAQGLGLTECSGCY